MVSGFEFSRVDACVRAPVELAAFEPGVVSELPAGDGEQATGRQGRGGSFEGAAPVVEARQVVDDAEERDEIVSRLVQRAGLDVVTLEADVSAIGTGGAGALDQLGAGVDTEVVEWPFGAEVRVAVQELGEAAVAAAEVEDAEGTARGPWRGLDDALPSRPAAGVAGAVEVGGVAAVEVAVDVAQGGLG